MAINNYSDQDFRNLQNQVDSQSNKIANLQESLNETNDNLHNAVTDIESIHSDITKINTQINNLRLDVNNLITRVNQIRNEIDNTIYPKLDDHEKRITVLESSSLVYYKTRKVLNPSYEEELEGTVLYMPKDLTKKDLELYNEDLAGKIYFGWFEKIFNPHGYGKVFFDFAPGEDHKLKGLTIGQQARIIIPLGVKIKIKHEKTALLHAIYNPLAVKGGLISGILTSKYTGEMMVMLVNVSPGVVYIGANDPLITLLHTFTYNTIPTQLSSEEEFNNY